MSFDAQVLYELMPAIYRIRDEALARAADPSDPDRRGPLHELLAVFAEQIGVVEENMQQLYDDLFIETCTDWTTPYIGDLIGYETLHGEVPRIASPRAEVAHTIALRRRKGTALVLEQLARDVTGWNARAVEFFELLGTTQYMNHRRLHSLRCPDLRDGEALEWIGTGFESVSRSVDVRRIESARGRHNIPNVGLFLWRLEAFVRSDSPAVRAGARRYRVSPLGHDLPLYGRAAVEEDITHLAGPLNVPLALTRRRLDQHLGRYYGERRTVGADDDNPFPSLVLTVDGTVIERDQVIVCNLSDAGAGWAHEPPAGRYAIDPVLGRVALPPEAPDPTEVRLTWHEGFSAEMGGGEYERGHTLPVPVGGVTVVRVPDDEATLTLALAAVAGDGVVEITDSGRYEENPAVQVAADGTVEIRAVNGNRPTLVLNGPMTVTGGARSGFRLSGMLVTGGELRVPPDAGNELATLSVTHCTLVPGRALSPAGEPVSPTEPSLVVETAGVNVKLLRTIVGGVRADDRSELIAIDSIIDSTSTAGVAFAAVDGERPGAGLAMEACTVIGKVHAREFGEVSNSVLLSARAAADTWATAVRVDRKQVGCVRFSFLPLDAIAPRRFRCQPDSAEAARRIVPRFSSLRYGTASYCQLRATAPQAIRQGADDESEMGAFHHLYGAQREANLHIRLSEYLRVGLRAGIFYES